MGENRDSLLRNVKDGRAEVRGVVWKRKLKIKRRKHTKNKAASCQPVLAPFCCGGVSHRTAF